MAALEFVVTGTPVSVQGSAEAKRFWQQRVTRAAEAARRDWSPSPFDEVVLRVAYFYVYAPRVPMTTLLATAFGGGSDFTYVAVDRAGAIEVFR